jgi:putative phosphoribosyl transferase
MERAAAVFRDRRDAGRRLAARLARVRHEAPVVLAIPRGGVPLAEEIADALGAPLDLLVVHSLGDPGAQVGAVAEGGLAVVDHDRAASLGIGADALAAMRGRGGLTVEAAARRLRDGRPRLDLVGRTVLLVDDGVGTGDVAIAATRAARRRGAARIVLAVPIAGPGALARLRLEADEVVCLEVAPTARWYERAAQVTDAEIAAALGVRTQPSSMHLPEAARGAVIVVSTAGAVRAALDGIGFATYGLPPDADAATIADTAGRLRSRPAVERLAIGCFGLGPAAEEALAAAALTPEINAVVAAGGRPDHVATSNGAATLLVIGGEDRHVLALARGSGRHEIAVVAGASHDFAEPGAIEQVAHLTAAWFARHAE